MKGRKERLVEAILTGNFRPDRQGRLLLDEPLPTELPIEGDEAAHSAWKALVDAQARGRESGAPDPWHFASLVRRLHGTFKVAAVQSAHERWRLWWACVFGPWKLVGVAGEGFGAERFSDQVLEEAWHGWVKFEPASHLRDEWDETDYGFRRFELGEDPQEAFQACRRLQDERAEAHWARIAAEISEETPRNHARLAG